VEKRRPPNLLALSLRDVIAGYAADAPPELNAVNLHIASGEMVCVLGPNGAGKSTLLRVASGLLTPRSGEVLLFDKPFGARHRIAQQLAVVEQTQEMSAAFTVREVVAMGRAPHQGAWMRPAAEDAAIVETALARCDLVALADRSARALSGGEQKRVAFARALAQEPSVLLLDEPGAFLDVRHALDLYELLATEVKHRGLACLVVMHDLNVAAQFADRVVLMKDGRIVAAGTVPEVMTYQRLKETFEADLYCGVNEVNDTRFFLPMRRRRVTESDLPNKEQGTGDQR